MKRVDNQPHSGTGETPQQHNHRLAHAHTHCTIRALEMDLGMERNSLIINNFTKHASEIVDKKAPGHPL